MLSLAMDQLVPFGQTHVLSLPLNEIHEQKLECWWEGASIIYHRFHMQEDVRHRQGYRHLSVEPSSLSFLENDSVFDVRQRLHFKFSRAISNGIETVNKSTTTKNCLLIITKVQILPVNDTPCVLGLLKWEGDWGLFLPRNRRLVRAALCESVCPFQYPGCHRNVKEASSLQLKGKNELPGYWLSGVSAHQPTKVHQSISVKMTQEWPPPPSFLYFIILA